MICERCGAVDNEADRPHVCSAGDLPGDDEVGLRCEKPEFQEFGSGFCRTCGRHASVHARTAALPPLGQLFRDDDCRIPTRDEHRLFVRRIWTWCVVGAILTFAATGGVVLGMFLSGYDSKKIVEVSTSVFQVVILSYGLGFFVPSFLTSLTKLSLGIEMSRRSLDLGTRTVQTLDKVDEAIERRLRRADALVGKLEQAADGRSPLFEDAKGVFRAEMERLRAEIRGERGRVDGALDEGEREAEAILNAPRHACGRRMEPDRVDGKLVYVCRPCGQV